MEALNAASLTPISVLSDQKRQPRKNQSLPSLLPLKAQNVTPSSSSSSSAYSSRTLFHGSLALLSSVINTGFAHALTYEEALQQSASSPPPSYGLEFDANGVLDSVISFGAENPAVILGGVTILAVPLILSQVLGNKSKAWGVESAKSAYAKLGDDSSAQLVDIRPSVELRKMGSPDVRGLGKKAVSIVYNGQDKPGFLKKLSLRFKEPENTTLYILDKFDGNSELVAELVTVNGFKAAYAIRDGAEGPRGWMNSGLPWIPPKKALSLDFSDITDAISGTVDGSDGLSLALGVAAAAGIGLLAFSEVETILQIVGSAALVQIFSRKLLFAENRKQTLKQVDEFLNTKVAPKELVDEIKQIGKALLPPTTSSKALPMPTEASPEAPPPPNPEPAAAEAAPQVNSVPKTEVQGESLSGLSRPLSPYPFYPDLKPPTSPTPSQP